MKTLTPLKTFGLLTGMAFAFFGSSLSVQATEEKSVETLSEILLADGEVPCRCYSILVEGHWVTVCIDDNGSVITYPENKRCEVLS